MMKYKFFVLFFWIGLSKAVAQPGRVLPADKILELIPNKISGFYLSTEPQGRLIKLGTLQYCMAEKDFSANRKRSIKILLFDYKEAPIMYNQATRKWPTYSVVETDTLIQRPIILPSTLPECTGWESYDAEGKKSQILLGIFKRFYLTVEGKNVDLEFLKKVLVEFKIDTFPK